MFKVSWCNDYIVTAVWRSCCVKPMMLHNEERIVLKYKDYFDVL